MKRFIFSAIALASVVLFTACPSTDKTPPPTPQQAVQNSVPAAGAAVDDPGKVKSFVQRMGMNYTVFIADQDLGNNFGGIRGIPTTFVIDKEGYIVRQYVGYRPKESFEQDIKDLM